MKINILIIDDDKEMAETVSELISGNKVVQTPGSISCKVLNSFDDAIAQMETSRFDLIILDLKDDVRDEHIGQDERLSGERVLEALRQNTFTPVIFHTGFGHKVEHLRSPFVRIVTKGVETPNIRNEIASILETNLPKLVRYIEEQQRSYLWDHIENHWNSDEKICEDDDLAHLLAKRLSSALSTDSIYRFFDPKDDREAIRPVAIYIWPPVASGAVFGDIVKSVDTARYFIVLTPICDCVQGKAEMALLSACDPIQIQREFIAISDDKKNNRNISEGNKKNLISLLRDNRQGKGIQPERYKFLPKTSFLPDLVIDLQKLSQVSFVDLNDTQKYQRIATVDSPFAEALQNRFTQYYGRVGTPDLDTDLVFGRITS